MKIIFFPANLLLIIIIVAVIAGGILTYQYWATSKKEVEIGKVQPTKAPVLEKEKKEDRVTDLVNDKTPRLKEIFNLKEERIFDGANNLVFENDLSAIHNGTPFEISFDIKLDDPKSKEYFGIMSTSNGASAEQIGFNISYDGKNHERARMYLYMIKGSPGAIIDILSEDGVYPDNNEWQNVKIVYNGAVGKFYMNQKLSKESVKMNDGNSQKPHSLPFTVGSFASNEYYLKGRLRNISIKVYE